MLLQANQYKVKVRRRDPFTEAARLVISSTGDVDLSPALARTPAEIKILAKALAAIPVRRQGKALLVRLFYDIDGGDMALCDAMMRSDDYEIEHMVPIRPQGDSDWSRIHGAAVGQVARRTGNLFVIPRGLNDALANSDWGHKRRVLARHPDAVVAPLGNHVRNAELWDAQAIEARQALLVEAGHRLWVENAPTTAAKPANAKAKTVHTNKASGRATRKPKRKGVRAPFLKAR